MTKSSILVIIFFLSHFITYSTCFSATKTSSVKFNTTLKQAKSGSPKAMFLVARMFENGKGTKKNISAASKWYQRSASQNYAAANAKLGKLYLEGIGVKKNIKKAFSLLNLAAIQGIPAAQFNLAILYELGIGTPKDLQEAIKWYDFAANGGYYTAKQKSDFLKTQLGIKTKTTLVTIPTTNITDTEPEEPESAPPLSQNTDDITAEIATTNDSDTKSESDKINEAQTENNTINEEQALLSNTFDREEIEPKNISLKTSQMDKKQKLALITDQNIKRTLKTLLEGRWFDKNRPVNFLPSPKANCNIINQIDIKCSSRQLQRRTDKETIYYKTLAKINKFTSKGSFLIQYQNTVVRVIADKIVNDDGVLYQSNIKEGLQPVIHQLTCQYQNVSNLVCVKDNSTIYNFKNRATVEKTPDA
ncbi:MAG: tetratricopeptide repeat protein [Gammaproteobacteria bacterium]